MHDGWVKPTRTTFAFSFRRAPTAQPTYPMKSPDICGSTSHTSSHFRIDRHIASESTMIGLWSAAMLTWNVPPALPRRAVLTNAAAAACTFGLVASPASADSVSDLLYGGGSNSGASVFEGTYTDPMHPGGTRTITLQGTKLGPFQLAKIVGGGGTGEPASYELPAMVSPTPGKKDSWQITIDFSPKGGPKDFTGYWDNDGIKFPPTPGQLERGNTAGNKWPKAT